MERCVKCGSAAALVGLFVVVSGAAECSWSQTVRTEDERYTAPGSDLLGYSVAVHGNMLVAGAAGGPANAGRAFAIDTRTGRVLFEMAPPDPAANDYFGMSVAVGDAYIVVGAPFNGALGAGAGGAYVFSAADGSFLYRLTTHDPAPGQNLGQSVAITGTTALVGAPGAFVGPDASGAVYVFDLGLGLETGKLVTVDSDPGDRVGYSLAVDGSVLVVGIPGDDAKANGGGAVCVFNLDDNQQLFKYTAFDGAADDGLGISVAVRGNVAVAGAPGAGGGAAYVFNASTGQFITKTASAHPVVNGHYGESVAIDDACVVVGAPYESQEQGVAYFYDRDTGDLVHELRPAGPDALHAGWSVTIASGVVYLGGPYSGGPAYPGAVFAYAVGPRVLLLEGSLVTEAGGDPAPMRVVADNATEYQWRKDGVDLVDGPLFSGATSPTLTIVPSEETEGEYRVVLRNAYAEVESQTLALGIRGGGIACLADADGNGVVDTRDVIAFLNAWNAGCP
ncbi:MAG TPA: hypothetical protein VFF69_02755 [Phycisphaerales bacterium]|nr:hypothetical protein [Phycisphaerales bacterium]